VRETHGKFSYTTGPPLKKGISSLRENSKYLCGDGKRGTPKGFREGENSTDKGEENQQGEPGEGKVGVRAHK